MKRLLTEWGKDLNSIPVAPLGLIAMPGCEELGEKINAWLQKWNMLEEVQDEEFFTVPGANRDSFLIKAYCPRFGTGESKGTLKESVRGYDVYILIDVCAYNKTYKMYGQEVPMSPDDHFQDLKRIIAAIGGKAKRVNVIMPMLYESRQHRRTSRESLDCAMGLQELENMGVDNIITFDAHDPRVQNAIPLIGFENVMPTYQMVKALCKAEKTLDFRKENIVIDPTTSAIGYGIEYTYSVMERIRMSALGGDAMLCAPMIVAPGSETAKIKEAKASGEDFPAWGDLDTRYAALEFATAQSYLYSGADLLVMYHPEAAMRTKKLITDLLDGKAGK